MSSSSARSPSRSLRLAACLPLALSSACVEHALIESVRPTEVPEPVAQQSAPPAEGSVWRGSTASGSFLYFDRKARGIGDLVTVVLTESLSAAGSANTSLDRQSGISASIQSEVGLAGLVQKGFREFLRFFGLGAGPDVPVGQELAVLESNVDKSFEGDGTTNRRSSFSGVVTCQVVEVLPGNLFRVYGKRSIVVNHELQLVTLEGLVRRVDINIDNTVASTQVADVKLTFDGIGVIDDEQRPGLLGRVFSWLYPF